jgi:hypothetical protein
MFGFLLLPEVRGQRQLGQRRRDAAAGQVTILLPGSAQEPFSRDNSG